MRLIAMLIIVSLVSACNVTPRRNVRDEAGGPAPTTAAASLIDSCTAGGNATGPIYDTFETAWRKKITTMDSKYIALTTDRVKIEPSIDKGFACVTYIPSSGSPFKVKLSVYAAPPHRGDNMIQHIEYSSADGGTHTFSMFVEPTTAGSYLTAFYFFDEAMGAGDSGGTWGGGK